MMKNRKESARTLRRALASRGQRFTRQRAKVFEVLAATDKHPTAEEVYRKVKAELPSVSLATVYKSLDALVQCELAQKLTYGDGSARYDATVDNHPHMRDLETGKVRDVPMDIAQRVMLELSQTLADEIRERTGFVVTGLRVEVLGHFADGTVH